MKRSTYCISLVFLGASLFVLLGTASAISLRDGNNKHNLAYNSAVSGKTYMAQPEESGGTDEVCIFCHTPHGADPDTPLWGHATTSGPRADMPKGADGGFPLYGNPLAIKGDTYNSTSMGWDEGSNPAAADRSEYKDDGSVTYPNGASRLCLSCHDGATAIGLMNDDVTQIAMVGGNDYLTGSAVVDLSTSHPISFVYDEAVRSDVEAVRGAGSYRLPPDGDNIDTPLDANNKMQCTTCHDPHEDTTAEVGLPFWRHTQSTGSGTVYEEVCTQCHLGI